MLFRVGFSTNLIQTGAQRLTLSIDGVHPNNDVEYLNAGLEYSWHGRFYLRAGRSSLFLDGGEMGLSLGAGLRTSLGNNLQLVLDAVSRDAGVFGQIQGYSLSLAF